jgi:type II secretion system protein I
MKLRFKSCEGESGYTFLEVMMTLIIFAVAILMIGSIFPLATRSLSKGKEAMRANYLAQEKLEELINEPNLNPQSSGNETVETYTRQWVIDSHATDPTVVDNLLRVRIIISWVDAYQQNQSVVLTTFVSEER